MTWGNKGGEERDTMNSQLGYLTATVEGLNQFIRDHMNTEEAKFASINAIQASQAKLISRQQSYLVFLSVMVFLDSAGYPVHEILKLGLKAFL